MKKIAKILVVITGFTLSIASTSTIAYSKKNGVGECLGDKNRNCGITKDSIVLCGNWVENIK